VALPYSHGNQALLDNVPGFGKSLDVLSKLFPRLPQKGKQIVRKYTPGNMGCKKEVSGRLAPARVI
jgi:hypothetical protein